MRSKWLVFWAGVLILFLFATSLWAGTTGKIKGTVKDKDTGAPLPGVNIVIKGTTMGAATNLRGEYFIINVRAGTYTLVATMVGYKAIEVANVKVSADLTTTMDFELEPTVLELGEVVEVISERPMIQRDVTSTSRLIGSEDIAQMPITDFADIVANQAGAVETGGDYSGGLHIRGGRSDEVVYIVDGVNTNDPVVNRRGITLDKSAIEEMSVISGGFNAEYGEAMSGVVNVVTKEGRKDFSGGLELTTDYPFQDSRYDFGYNKANLTIGGPIPLGKNLTYFLQGAYYEADDRDPAIIRKSHNDIKEQSTAGKLVWKPIKPLKVRLSGNWAKQEYHTYSHSRSRGDWVNQGYLAKKGNSQFVFNLTHTLSRRTFYTFNLSGFNTYTKYSAQNGRHYHDFRAIGPRLAWVGAAIDSGWYDQEWDRWEPGFDPDSVWLWYYTQEGWYHPATDTAEAHWESIIQKQEAYNDHWYDTGCWHLNEDTTNIYYEPFDLDGYLWEVANSPKHQSDKYEGDIDKWAYPYPRDEFSYFVYNFFPRWHERITTHYTANFDLTSQVDKYNQVKGGLYLRKNFLEYTDIQFSNDRPYSDHYEQTPISAAVYLQDKLEYEDMTINAGVRVDYFDPKAKHPIDLENLDQGMAETDPKYKVSPRFGVAFAVSDKTVMYGNYGRFFQVIQLGELYMNLQTDLLTGWPLVGNPDIPPEETVAYEVGLKHAFTPDLAGQVTAYYKDVHNLLATREVNTLVAGKRASYTIFKVEDFATVKGIDLTLTKRASRYLSSSVGYSYLNAKGSGSSGREAYYIYIYTGFPDELPKQEYPLDFDVTHSLKANLNLYLPRRYGPKLFGFRPLSDLNANLLFTFSSGPPYTPEATKGGQPLEMGSKRLPSTHRTDLRVDKMFSISKDLGIGFFVDVRNLFDVENVINVYHNTGKPDDDDSAPIWDPSQWGNYAEEGYSSRHEMYEAAYADWYKYTKSPFNYGAPRLIKAGVTFHF